MAVYRILTSALGVLQLEQTKYPRGTCIYKYKRREFLDKPNNTVTGKMLYDADANRTYIYCYNIIRFDVVILLACIVAVAALNYLIIKNMKYTIRYNSIVFYYNDSLYVNIKNDSSLSGIKYSLKDIGGNEVCSGVIDKGHTLYNISIERDDVQSEYTMDITCNYLLTRKNISYTIFVRNMYDTEDTDAD